MTRPYCEVDTECDHDYWLCKFYTPDGNKYDIDMFTGGPPLNVAAIRYFIENYTLVTFNGDNYDVPMISYALAGATPRQLKEANDNIIKGGLKRWNFYKAYGVDTPPGLDHVDVMEVAPGVRVGLKTYMGRMHAPLIQDLPFDPDHPMPVEMRPVTALYCGNDLDGTRMLRETVAERLQLRIETGADYGIDLRSKSDAQMAEAIIKSQLSFTPEKRIVPHGYQFQYEPPPYIRFSTPTLQAVLATVRNAFFICNDIDQLRGPGMEHEELVDADGKKIKTGVRMPPELKEMLIPIGSSKYQFGIGGLHSTEKAVNHHTIIGKQTVSDHDVKSYYPSLIINLQIIPSQLGPEFLTIYKREYDDRISAKDEAARLFKLKEVAAAAKLQTKADGKKILLNGTFGKLFSKYSILFAPELGIRVTITGQLCLLMLIESLELCGIRVVSANTDGIVVITPAGREWLRDSCIRYWEAATGLETEANFYRSIYSQSVNSYLAVKLDGKTKGKGYFAESGVVNNVHPEKDVCTDAVVAYLTKGVPLAQTIRACTDIRKFLVIRSVKGGGIYYPKSLGMEERVINADGAVYLGKTVRWYFAVNNDQCIHYFPKPVPEVPQLTASGKPKAPPSKLGNKVAGSEGARPCMRLPTSFPSDVDYDKYIADAVKMLATVGVEHG